MGRIRVLDKHTAELIAAGEVVERPASVVKELVENAIDAGASVITVEIKNGGVSEICITDDGCGFAREDVPTAFLRHATSKIREERDLDGIATLGFRGEALASVAAVARVQLVTRTQDDVAGTCYRIEGGDEQELTDIGCPVGTTICVRDLFYNVPARMKFLKKDVGEANAVAGVVDRLALSHPEISFRFIRDGKDELLTPGDGQLLSCISAVLGRDFAKSLVEVDYTLNGVRVHGYSCRPDAARPNRTMQHFFVNNRYVKTRTAMAALEQAYKGAVMVGKFPSCVLYIDLPPETVDVNVHPAKIEVRFVNEKPVFDCVYHGIRSMLDEDHRPHQVTLPTPQAQQPKIISPTPARELARQTVYAPTVTHTPPAPKPAVPPRPLTQPLVMRSSASVFDDGWDAPTEPKPTAQPAPVTQTVDVAEPPIQTTLEQPAETPIRYIGEVFETYILVQQGDSLFMIDKHAAHERILYNDLKQAEQHDAQYLLTPVTVPLSREEYAVLTERFDALSAVGFDVSDFGSGSLLVRAVPSVLFGQDEASLLREIAGGLLGGRREVTTASLDWLYHSVACRAAVKAGNKSTPQELAALAKRVLTEEDIRTCPHGRPVLIELTQKELEKQFGRIV